MDDQTLLDQLDKVRTAVHEAKDETLGEVRKLGERVTRVETLVGEIHTPPCAQLGILEHHHDGLRSEVEENRKTTRNWLLSIAAPVIVGIILGGLAIIWRQIAG